MINRRVIRTVKNTTEITALVAQAGGAAVAWDLQTTDFVYVGYHGKFAARFFEVGAANTDSSVLSVDFWNGTAWEAVDDLVDQTSVGGKTFAQSGFVSWQNKETWVQRSLTGIDSDVELYWVRLSVSVNLNAATTLRSILNLYCDDNLVRAYFPEIITDTNYLPDGKTTFLDQYIAAKNMVVLRLKQRKAIDDESQIVDVNDVAVAATYAAACIIMKPIATSDAAKAIAMAACQGFDDEIGKVTIPVDENKDGIISDDERGQPIAVKVERR